MKLTAGDRVRCVNPKLRCCGETGTVVEVSGTVRVRLDERPADGVQFARLFPTARDLEPLPVVECP